MSKRLILCITSILAMLFFENSIASWKLQPGDIAPNFKLLGSDGRVHDLSDYRGKTVVLAWFPKAFTGG